MCSLSSPDSDGERSPCPPGASGRSSPAGGLAVPQDTTNTGILPSMISGIPLVLADVYTTWMLGDLLSRFSNWPYGAYYGLLFGLVWDTT